MALPTFADGQFLTAAQLAAIEAAVVTAQGTADAASTTASSAVALTRYVSINDPVYGATVASTDNAAAINAALSAAGSAGGGKVIIPPGLWKYGSLITVPDGVTLEGHNRYTSILQSTFATGDCISLGLSSEIRHLRLASTSARTAGNTILAAKSATISDFTITDYFCAVNILGASSAALAVNVNVRNGLFFSPGVTFGSTAVAAQNFANLVLDNLQISGPSTGTQPSNSVVIRNGDTVFLNEINATHHGAFAVIPQAGENCYAIRMDNCLWDSANTGDAGQIVPAGGVYDTVISNSWFGLSTGTGLNISPNGSGIVDGISIANTNFPHNTGGCGLLISGATIKNVDVKGGTAAGNSSQGCQIAGGATHVSLIGFRAGNVASRGANGAFGISTTGASDYYVIQGCNTQGNTSGGLADTASGIHKSVTGNL